MTVESTLFDEETERPTREMPLIRRMWIEQLFNQYTYDIRVAGSTAPRVILLYGDNGSGKTTILNLLWHLLATAGNRGHRTSLAKTPFKTFSVMLTNGDVISAIKKGDIVGDFEIVVRRKNKVICREAYPTGPDGKVRAHRSRVVAERLVFSEEGIEEVAELETEIADSSPPQDLYIDYLKSINIDPYLLADDRRIYNDRLPGEDALLEAERIIRGRGKRADEISSLAAELEDALRRTNNWLRQQIISGTAQGSQGADAIYLDVLSQLAGAPGSFNEEPSLEDVKKRISELDLRTKQFNEFGLVPRFRANRFLDLLENVQPSRVSLIADVLTPYLDGQRARLDSLQPMESLVRIFVETVNSFLVDKRLKYTLRRGLWIETADSRSLEADQLSSGERQLLLLLCNALLSRSESALFIIDEPEISLNVKWQRKLIAALLACVQSSGVQFVLATHSIEIITGHREFLAQLHARGEKNSLR